MKKFNLFLITTLIVCFSQIFGMKGPTLSPVERNKILKKLYELNNKAESAATKADYDTAIEEWGNYVKSPEGKKITWTVASPESWASIQEYRAKQTAGKSRN